MLRYNCPHCNTFDGEAHMCPGKASERQRLEASAQVIADRAERRFQQHRELRDIIEDAYKRADSFRRLEHALRLMDRGHR